MPHHRLRAELGALVGLLVLLLAAGACGAPAGEERGRATTTAPVSAADDGDGGSDSAIADRTRALESALYDPAEHRGPARPVRLELPAIGVAGAPVQPVALEPDGEMEIPPASEVGWYELGVAPGERGSAVLAAHIAYDGVDGVFRHLDRLSAGDEVVVTLDDGSTLRYRVTELRTYAKDALPEGIFSRSEPERLVLITCGGSFDRQRRSYDSNVVAYAEPVVTRPSDR